MKDKKYISSERLCNQRCTYYNYKTESCCLRMSVGLSSLEEKIRLGEKCLYSERFTNIKYNDIREHKREYLSDEI